MSPNLRIKVLLLVGNHLLCKSLVRIIQQKPDILVIRQSVDLSDIAFLIAKLQSDVVLLDSVSARALNRQCVGRIQDLNPNTQILMIGMDADEDAFKDAKGNATKADALLEDFPAAERRAAADGA